LPASSLKKEITSKRHFQPVTLQREILNVQDLIADRGRAQLLVEADPGDGLRETGNALKSRSKEI
jgi:hypothetical protein